MSLRKSPRPRDPREIAGTTGTAGRAAARREAWHNDATCGCRSTRLGARLDEADESVRLQLQSEPLPATGGVAAAGVRSQLGRPRLDLLTVLVRETVQNSWDARAHDAGGIRFCLAGRRISADQLRALRTEVFAQLPPEG